MVSVTSALRYITPAWILDVHPRSDSTELTKAVTIEFCHVNARIAGRQKRGRQRSGIKVPYLTWNKIWKSDKNTRKQKIQENQEVSPFPAGGRKAARNKHD